MHTLATLYLAARIYAHRAHNLVCGPSFFADHAFLGELYDIYDDAYDALVERMLGLGQAVEPIKLTEAAIKMVQADPCRNFFSRLLEYEKKIRTEIKLLAPSTSDGTQNLLQGLADESEQRTYKMTQRCA